MTPSRPLALARHAALILCLWGSLGSALAAPDRPAPAPLAQLAHIEAASSAIGQLEELSASADPEIIAGLQEELLHVVSLRRGPARLRATRALEAKVAGHIPALKEALALAREEQLELGDHLTLARLERLSASPVVPSDELAIAPTEAEQEERAEALEIILGQARLAALEAASALRALEITQRALREIIAL